MIKNNTKTNKMMTLKISISMMMLAGLLFFYRSVAKRAKPIETPIDKVWWDVLSEEWQTIFIISQSFQQQRVNIYSIQEDYINRMNSGGEENYSEMNKPLYDFVDMKRFGLSYYDFYARALRTNYVVKNEKIDLSTLATLDEIYMVNGPGDLTPLKNFPNLKVLIINHCGGGYNIPLKKQLLDLEPLRHLQKLEILHCSSHVLESLEPIEDLVNLRELDCGNSGVTSLAPLKKLVNLRSLTVGSKVENVGVVSGLANLEELYIKGCKKVPDLARLKKLKKLSVGENEMAIVSGKYRIIDIDFLKKLTGLQFLDLSKTSYKGSLTMLDSFQNLKAFALPPVSSFIKLEFKKSHPDCIILNAYGIESF